jgi:hypothetical protein
MGDLRPQRRGVDPRAAQQPLVAHEDLVALDRGADALAGDGVEGHGLGYLHAAVRGAVHDGRGERVFRGALGGGGHPEQLRP